MQCYNKDKGIKTKGKMLWSIMVKTTVLILCCFWSISYLYGCDNKKKNKQITMQEAIYDVRKQCKEIIMFTDDDKFLENIEYGLDNSWVFSHNEIEVLYQEGFFFLLEKQSNFTKKENETLDMRIYSKYSCSDVTPHLVFLERTFVKHDRKENNRELLKTEVLENDSFVETPTKTDIQSDVLYKSLKWKKTNE